MLDNYRYCIQGSTTPEISYDETNTWAQYTSLDFLMSREGNRRMLRCRAAKRTVEERMENPNMPGSERFRWHWSKQKFVIAEVKPMTWTDLDTRAAKLQWVGNALTAISGTTIVVLRRGI